jgi:AcrR family transcriptional regulator
MAGFSIEAVARQAGASKATIYRHWSSPPALLVDAMEVATQPFPVPNTGSLRSDLIDLGSKLEGLLRDQDSSRLIAAFIDAAERDSQLKDLLVRLGERRREVLRKVLVAARERGEVPRSRDLELLVDLLAAPVFYRRFIAHTSVPRGYTAAVVDLVLAAAVGPPPSGRTRRRELGGEPRNLPAEASRPPDLGAAASSIRPPSTASATPGSPRCRLP